MSNYNMNYNMNLNKKVNFVEWKWSNGEKPEKTPRNFKNNTNSNASIDINDNIGSNTDTNHELNFQLMQQMQQKEENQVINQCLYSSDEPNSNGFKDFLDNKQSQLINEFQLQPNKREDTYNRMAEREMVGQIGMNPFFSYGNGNGNNASYIEDLMNQENYLKPISTSLEKER